MTNPADPLFRNKWGVAVLAVCLAETINEADPSFRDRFLEKLEAAYRKLRDESQNDEIQGLELINWTREALTGFSLVEGQGEPFFRRE
jgi:hypothetical protein